MKQRYQLFLTFYLLLLFSAGIFAQPSLIEVTTTPADCHGSATGTIRFAVTGGAKPYYYSIFKDGVTITSPNTSDTTYTFINVSPGVYFCFVTDATSLVDGVTRTVGQPDPISIVSVTTTPITCTGFNDGEISLTASGESGNYSFLLLPDNITSNTGFFDGRSPGNYTVQVSDATGCLTTATTDVLVFSEPPPIIISDQSFTGISCNGVNDGTISIIASGGTGTLIYTITPGGTSNATGMFSNLPPGIYTVDVTDTESCPSATSIPINIAEPDILEISSESATDASCNGVSDGTVSVTVTGGTAPYIFTLSPGGSTNGTGIFPGLPAGTYTVSVTDANSCGPVLSGSLVISQPPPITITSSGLTQISCHNSNNGTITVTAEGGNAPLEYTLNPGAVPSATGIFTGLSAGTYTVTVSDPLGCSPATTATLTIINPDPVTITGQSHTEINCSGDNNGTISITASGGTGALRYILNPGSVEQSNGNFTGLGPNTYTVSVTDQNGCPAALSAPVTLNEPALLQLSSESATDASCNGVSDGTVSVTATGGTAPYIFTLSPGGNTNATGNFTGLPAGTYTVSVTDANSCGPVLSGSLVINQPPPITITGSGLTQITCHNSNNGTITVTATGGNAPLEYTLNPGAVPGATGIFTGLAAGTYTVTVSDPLGCTPATTAPLTIINPDPITITGQSHTEINCSGDNNGTISITASGGTGALIYTLNPGSVEQSNGNFTGLGPNTYTVSVTDQNGCPAALSAPVTIIDPAPINVSVEISSKLMVSCHGGTDGTINISVIGGTAPYSYAWTGPAGFTSSLGNIAGLAPGTYNLTVTDSRLCVSENAGIATITEPPLLQISLSKTDISCNGNPDGSITASASGGTPPYEYSRNGITWQASNVFSNLPKNDYTILVRDNNLCIASSSISITEPNELLIISEISISENKCYGDSLGEIRILTVTGGTQPYEYSINGGVSFSTSPIFTNLPAGSYPSVVRDASGCVALGSNHIISQPTRIRISNYTQVDVTGCYYNNNGQIAIEATGGTGTRNYQLDGGIPNASGIFTSLSGGSHYIAITDNNNCLKDTTVFLGFPDPILFSSLTLTNVTGCGGDTNGAISASANGGTGSLQYSLNGGVSQLSGDFSGLAAGNYTLTVTDGNNCIKDTLVTLTEPEVLAFSSVNITDISCAGLDNGRIDAVATGGTSPYTFTLNPGGISRNDGEFTGLAQGIYIISLTDDAGCGPVISNPLTINEPNPIIVDSVRFTHLICAGDNSGLISIYARGGVSPLEYSVNNGLSFSSNNQFTGLSADSYQLLVRDFNACILTSDLVQLIEPAPLTIINETVQDVTTCNGDLTGLLNLLVSGGTGSIEYSLGGINWQASGAYSGLPAGSYTIQARDEAGCTLSSSILQINEPDAITADFETTLYKDEFNKGSLRILNPAGGTGALEFSINGLAGPFTGQTEYTGLDEGNYTVVVRDQNGCRLIRVVVISAVPPLEVNITVSQITCNGFNNGSILIEVLNPDGAVEYSIDDSASWHSQNTFESLIPGTYRIVVRDEAERYHTAQVTITQPSPINIMSDITPAPCNAFRPNAAITLNVTGGTGVKTYLWSDGATTKDRTGLNSGDYTVTVTDENGCVEVKTINAPAVVTVNAYAGADTFLCEGTVFTLEGQGGTEASWFPVTGLSNPNITNPVVTITEPVSYVLTITGLNNCYNVDTINIGVYPKLNLNAGNDTSVIENSPVFLNATGGPYVSYLWEPSAGLDDPASPAPVSTLASSRIYILTAVDEHGCVEKDTLTIHVIDKILIYSSFSPNDDGVNDYWDIDYAELYPEIVVEVYTRWGERIFSSKGYSNEQRWDGFYRGKEVPIGTYYYVVVPYKGAKALTGPVTIVR